MHLQNHTFAGDFAGHERDAHRSSLHGEYVFSPSLSCCLALVCHFIPKQNYWELLLQVKRVKDESQKKMVFYSYLTSLLNFLHLIPCDCFSNVLVFSLHSQCLTTRVYWNVNKNLFTCFMQRKGTQRTCVLFGYEDLFPWLTTLTANKARIWVVKRIHAEMKKCLSGISPLSNNSFYSSSWIYVCVHTEVTIWRIIQK